MADREDRDDLCEECGEREVSCTVAMMMGGQMIHRRLCENCLAKMNAAMTAGGVKNLLGALMSALTGQAHPQDGQDQAEDAVPDLTCPECRTDYADVKKTGRMGCPRCYEAFSEQVLPALQKRHGQTQHVGRRPLNTEAAQQQRALAWSLSWRMARAAEAEDYETAARLRDELQALSRKEGDA